MTVPYQGFATTVPTCMGHFRIVPVPVFRVEKILSLLYILCTIEHHIGYLLWFKHAYNILICDLVTKMHSFQLRQGPNLK